MIEAPYAYLVAAVLRYSSPGLAAADEPKPKEAATNEGKGGRLGNRCRRECEGVYSVICYGVTAHVIRVIVGTAVAPDVRLLARNRKQDARYIKNRIGPRIH